jgi:RHS repeat-associated protein
MGENRSSGGMRWSLLAVALLVFAVIAGAVTSATAASDPSRYPADTDNAVRANPHNSPFSVGPYHGASKAVLHRQLARWKRQHQRASRELRVESAKRYADLPRDESSQLAQQAFDDYFHTIANPTGGDKGDEVVNYLNDSVAVVDPDGSAKNELEVSTTPLRVETDSGKEPLDLTLERSSQGYVPRAGGATLELPSDPQGSIVLGAGASAIQFRLPSGSDAASPELLSRSKAIFYGDVARDTDLVVSPMAGGFRLAAQLRSAASPGRIVIPIDLPAGDELRTGSTGQVEILDGDGNPDAVVSPTVAFDADGRSIPVSVSTEGDSLVLDVEHGNGAPHYPILVDPTVTNNELNSADDFETNPSGSTSPGRGWTYWEGRVSGSTILTEANNYDPSYGPYIGSSGLFIGANTPNGWYPSSMGEWYASVPNTAVTYGGATHTSAYYSQVTFQAMSFYVNANSSTFTPYLEFGLGSWASNSYLQEGVLYGTTTNNFTYSNSDVNAKRVQFDLNSGSSGAYLQASPTNQYRYAFLDGITTRIADQESPSASAGSQTPVSDATHWIKSPPTNATFTYTGSDAGLGIKSMGFKAGLTTTSPPVSQTASNSCTGGWNEVNACPQSRPNVQFTYNASLLPEGINSLWAVPVDVVDKTTTTKLGEMRIDTHGPSVTPSGGLFSPTQSGYDLHVVATDGSTDTDATARSGVVEAKLTVDNPGHADQVLFDRTQTNDTGTGTRSSAPLKAANQDYTLDPTTVTNGSRLFTLTVTDQAGNATIQTWHETVDTIPPETTITSGPSGPTNNNSPQFEFSSSESNSTFRCKLAGPGHTEDYGPCPPPKVYTGLADGDYTFSVKAKDQAGNEDASEDTRSFKVDTVPPQTTITSGPSGPTNNNSPQFDFSSSEANSTFRCKLAGPGHTEDYGPCPPPQSYTGLPDGHYTFSVKAKDQAGNEDGSPDTRSFDVDTTPPQTTINSGPSGPTNNNSPQFDFSSSEANSTFRCKLAGPGHTEDYGPCPPPQSDTGLADGDYIFSVKAKDQAGNEDASEDTRSFKVDTIAPETTITSGPSGPTNNGSPSFAFSSSEANSTFQCKLDGPGSTTGASGSCSSPKSYSSLDGTYTFSVTATDQAGNVDPSPAVRTFSPEPNPPETSITSGPSGTTREASPGFGFASSKPDSTFQCKLDGPDSTLGTYSSCSDPKSYSSLADGAYTFSVKATDHVGNEDPTPASQQFTLDATAPDTTITFGPNAVTADPTPTFGFESADPTATFICRFDSDDFSACSGSGTHTPSQPLSAGAHTFEVKAVDEAGNADPSAAQRAFVLVSGLLGDTDTNMLGLEQFFDYDSTETGLSAAHANLHTGNLVWHSVPMVNAGRGLASVVNMTYNSYERKIPALPDLSPLATNQATPQGAKSLLNYVDQTIQHGGQTAGTLLERLPSSNMLPTGYNTAGPGFSAGLSGVTRINEPLRVPGGVLPLEDPTKAQLTDADGSVHTFTLDESKSDVAAGKYVYEQPKGINLQLRTYANGPGLTNKENSPKTWAITRPEGPTEFYDGWGFLRSIVDRDGNTMRFDYKQVNALTGDPCGSLPVTPVVCEPRLEKVVDAAGVDGTKPEGERSFDLTYNDYAMAGLLNPNGSATQALQDDIANGTVPVPGASDGLLQSITDHSGRELKLDYDTTSNTGRLVKMTDNATGLVANQRSWGFAYDSPGQSSDQPQLTSVSDPNGNATTFDYWPAGSEPGRQIKSVVLRHQAGEQNPPTRTYSEITEDPASHLSTANYEDARGNPEQAVTDAEGRPTQLTDAAGQVTAITYDDAASSHDNNVSSVTYESSDPQQQAAWHYTWGSNGEMRSETDPIGRETSIDYCTHEGTSVSPIGSDAGGAFVVDMAAIHRPSTATYSYGLDGGTPGDCSGVSKGHVTTTERPPTFQGDTHTEAHATYNSIGELTSSTNEAGEMTTYSSFDANGLPQAVVSPRGNENGASPMDFRTIYHYDAQGNVQSVVDPRGSHGLSPGSVPDENGAYTTTLSYDKFDQLKSEIIPRDTGGSGERVFLTHPSFDYDANGNMTAKTDGENNTTVTTYTPMDRTDQVTDAENETVDYGYDAESSVTSVTAPKGVATPETSVPHDFETEYDLDPLGRPLAKIQHSSADPDLITSYSYDRLDNVVGMALPRDNVTAPSNPNKVAIAESNAADPAHQRVAFDYDKASQLLSQIENPNGSCTSSNQKAVTSYDYDVNGNRTLVTRPRAACEPGSAAQFETRTDYDVLDRPIQVTDAPGVLDYETNITYDPMGRVISKETPNGSATTGAGDYTTRYGYNADGDLTSRSVPYSAGQYGLGAQKLDVSVTYQRNEVGDPIKITDPRGTEVTNTFYDTGELKSTDRPWWWRMDWSSPATASPTAGKRFGPTSGGIAPDLAVPTNGPTLGEGGPLQDGPQGEISQGGLSGDFGDADPEKLPDFLPRAGHTTFTYDGDGRLETVKADGTGGPARVSSIGYDNVGRITTKTWPYGTQGGDPTDISHAFDYDKNGNLKTYTDGVGAAGGAAMPLKLSGALDSPLTSADYQTHFSYDQFDRRTTEDAPGSAAQDQGSSPLSLVREVTNFSYDPNGNVLSIETPRGSATSASSDYSLTYAYDPLDRLQTETNAAGEHFDYSYNADSDMTLASDPLQHKTALTYDDLGRVKDITEAQGTGVARTTQLTLDPEGNVTRSVAPGAAYEQGGSAPDQVTDVSYDGLGQPWKTTTGAGAPASSNSLRTQITQRDADGNVVREIGGLGASDQDAIGRMDPYADTPQGEDLRGATLQATVHSYDVDGLMKTTYLPHSAGEDERTEDPNNHDHRYRTNFSYDATGRLNGVDDAYDFTHSPDPNNSNFDVQARTTHVDYTRFGTGWIRSSSDLRDAVPNQNEPADPDQSIRYAYDPRGFQTEWTTGGFSNGRDSSRQITRESYPSGTMYERHGVKLTSTNAEDTTEDSRTYTYFYNANRSLSETQDKIPSFPGAPSGFEYNRKTTIARDPAERELRVNEDWRLGRDTTFSYDEAGNVTTRRTDGRLVDPQTGDACTGAGSGCDYVGDDRASTGFTYDALDRETTMERTSDGETQGWRTQWWPNDKLESRTRIDGALAADPANDDVAARDSRFFWPSGDPSARVHDPGSSEGPSTQTYAYDLNGNRTFDERGIHTYNARSQQTSWQRPDDSGPGAAPAGNSYADDPGPMAATGLTSYSQIDGTGKVLKQSEDLSFKAKLSDDSRPGDEQQTDSTFKYKDGQLRQVVALTHNQIAGHSEFDSRTRTISDYSHYDDLGNVRRIKSDTETLSPGDDPPDPDLAPEPASVPGCASEISDWTDSNTTYHCFDPFGRLIATQAPKPDTQTGRNPTISYIYDGLDRRDVGLKSVAGGGNSTASERSYIGTSQLLSRETDPEHGVASRSYAYDSQGLRLGAQAWDQGPTPNPHFDGYSTDANGSVIALEDQATGESGPGDKYSYDPYGDLLDPDPGDQQTAEQSLSDEAKSNPFRFEGFYYDSGIQSYDMQARQYRPDVGIFLSQDRFEAAGADLALQTDPLTQNRYSFAGGNPVSNIEFDGHCAPDNAQNSCTNVNGDSKGNGNGGFPQGTSPPAAATDPLPSATISVATSVATNAVQEVVALLTPPSAATVPPASAAPSSTPTPPSTDSPSQLFGVPDSLGEKVSSAIVGTSVEYRLRNLGETIARSSALAIAGNAKSIEIVKALGASASPEDLAVALNAESKIGELVGRGGAGATLARLAGPVGIAAAGAFEIDDALGNGASVPEAISRGGGAATGSAVGAVAGAAVCAETVVAVPICAAGGSLAGEVLGSEAGGAAYNAVQPAVSADLNPVDSAGFGPSQPDNPLQKAMNDISSILAGAG